jgi:hypothetical protein
MEVTIQLLVVATLPSVKNPAYLQDTLKNRKVLFLSGFEQPVA